MLELLQLYMFNKGPCLLQTCHKNESININVEQYQVRDSLFHCVHLSQLCLHGLRYFKHFYVVLTSWITMNYSSIAGNKGSILGSKGFEETILEISHKIHDVVSTTRRTKNNQWRIWAGNLLSTKKINRNWNGLLTCFGELYLMQEIWFELKLRKALAVISYSV